MNSAAPLVSVIVPTFNAARYLPALCDSILAQTYTNFEALFYDDGSTDNTREIFKPYLKDPRFRLICDDQNHGVNAATNELFKLFRGKYWCHPGADDLLLPDFIERRLALLEQEENAAFIHGPAKKTINEAGDEIDVADPVPRNFPARMAGVNAISLLLQHNVVATPSIMVRSETTKKVLPYFQTNWKYAQDWYLWLLHAATDGEFLWDPEPLHIYRVHSGSLSNIPEKAAIRRAELRLVPLTALSCAASYSRDAAEVWDKWKAALYDLWLVRAFSLQKENLLDPAWMRTATEAYYGPGCSTTLSRELIKGALSMFTTFLRERKMRANQVFTVSGLAQLDHPFFHKAVTSR
jgi:teichuronic acid biosynthesis glycosyltransferase TuaG